MSASVRIGLIGLDTSHVTAFTKLLNDPADPNHVPGGKVVIGFPGGSKDWDLSINRVEGFTKDLKEKWGVKIVDSIEAVAEGCDIIFLESVDGRVHLEQFKRVVGYGKPVFIDKPLAIQSDHAREIFKLAAAKGIPVMSSSALRYSANLVQSLARPAAEAGGDVVGCDTYGPMALQPTLPGLFWYGCHSVEVMFTVLGAGCQQVSVVANPDFDLVTGVWKDGRIGAFRGSRKGHGRFGVTIHRTAGAEHLDLSANTKPYYAGLLEAIMGALPQGRSAIADQASIEVVRFMEAANESRDHGGRTVTL